MSNAFTTQNFFQPAKRMDILNEDAPKQTSGALDEAMDPSGNNSSGDVKDANGVSEGFRPFQSGATIKSCVPSTSKAVTANNPASAWPGKKV